MVTTGATAEPDLRPGGRSKVLGLVLASLGLSAWGFVQSYLLYEMAVSLAQCSGMEVTFVSALGGAAVGLVLMLCILYAASGTRAQASVKVKAFVSWMLVVSVVLLLGASFVAVLLHSLWSAGQQAMELNLTDDETWTSVILSASTAAPQLAAVIIFSGVPFSQLRRPQRISSGIPFALGAVAVLALSLVAMFQVAGC